MSLELWNADYRRNKTRAVSPPIKSGKQSGGMSQISSGTTFVRPLAHSNSPEPCEGRSMLSRIIGGRDYESRAASYPGKGFLCTCINNTDPCKDRPRSAASLLSHGFALNARAKSDRH